MTKPKLPSSWNQVLSGEFRKPYFTELQSFIARERTEHEVYPPEKEVYAAFHATPFDEVRVLLLGQDPYHDENQAHGLCFSVRPGVTPPPSLRNILKELHSNIGCAIPNNGDLMPWAKQGVLMLNAVLTVQAHKANSHKGKGWEVFTDEVIRAVSAKKESVVFVLWGAYAGKKKELIDTARHIVIESAHPSPLSARNGFFGSRPFSKINAALKENSSTGIDWCLPNL